MKQRGRLWRTAAYLGLVRTKPRPRVGSRGWWFEVLELCVVVVIAVLMIAAVT